MDFFFLLHIFKKCSINAMLLWGRKEEKKGWRKKEKKVVELFLNLKRYELSMLVVY